MRVRDCTGQRTSLGRLLFYTVISTATLLGGETLTTWFAGHCSRTLRQQADRGSLLLYSLSGGWGLDGAPRKAEVRMGKHPSLTFSFRVRTLTKIVIDFRLLFVTENIQLTNCNKNIFVYENNTVILFITYTIMCGIFNTCCWLMQLIN